MSLEVIVEELASVVAIEAEDGEGEAFFDEDELLKDAGFSFSPDGALFCPSSGDIDQIDGIDVHSGRGLATMSHGIGFKKAGARFVPLVGFDGDLLSQEGPWFCGRLAPFCVMDPDRFQNPVYGGRRDLQQGLCHIHGEFTEALNITRQPDRQDDLETF